jgi:hypothetical protein
VIEKEEGADDGCCDEEVEEGEEGKEEGQRKGLPCGWRAKRRAAGAISGRWLPCIPACVCDC